MPLGLCLPTWERVEGFQQHECICGSGWELNGNGCLRLLNDIIAQRPGSCEEEPRIQGRGTGDQSVLSAGLCCSAYCASLLLDAAGLQKPLTMIDSSKKQQQGFPEILTAGDFEPLKEKECLEGSNQKSLKEGQCVCARGHKHPIRVRVSQAERVCLRTVPCVCSLCSLGYLTRSKFLETKA